MAIFESQSILLILLATGIALSLCLHLLHLYKDMHRSAAIAKLRSAVEHVSNDLNGLCSGSIGIGKRVSRLEMKLKSQELRQNKLENAEPNLQVYGQAMALVHKGAKVDEVVSYCGLSRGEAELLMFINNETEKTQQH